MGFDAYFFARLDYQDKEKRLAEKTMEWDQRPMYDSLGDGPQILTHALYNFYNSPDSFDWDTTADENDPPFVTNEKL